MLKRDESISIYIEKLCSEGLNNRYHVFGAFLVIGLHAFINNDSEQNILQIDLFPHFHACKSQINAAEVKSETETRIAFQKKKKKERK